MSTATKEVEALSPMQAEIAFAVAHATQPLVRQLARVEQELAALRQGEVSEWMSVKEAAGYLNVCQATIRRRVSEGIYETRRDGGKIIQIRRADVVG